MITTMTIGRLLTFIHAENDRLDKKYRFSTKLEALLAKTVKMGEELGELYGEILGTSKLVRKEKLGRYSRSTIEDEIADCIITTLLVADSLGVDVSKALEKKIEKINQRYSRLP